MITIAFKLSRFSFGHPPFIKGKNPFSSGFNVIPRSAEEFYKTAFIKGKIHSHLDSTSSHVVVRNPTKLHSSKEQYIPLCVRVCMSNSLHKMCVRLVRLQDGGRRQRRSLQICFWLVFNCCLHCVCHIVVLYCRALLFVN